MGNRGIIHDHESKTLKKSRWAHPNWITCVISFKGRKRTIMGKGTYTELFFLDEVTALSAGHRPCFECRREAAKAFFACDARARGLAEPAPTKEFDQLVHKQRVKPRIRQQITWRAELADLPDGVMVAHNGAAFAKRADLLLQWSMEGYAECLPQDGIGEVDVLTPRLFVGILAHGFKPVWHDSAARF